jgi:hypothetical protein
VVQRWKLHLPSPYDNAHPAPPCPDVGHLVETERLWPVVTAVLPVGSRQATASLKRLRSSA